MRAVVLTPYLTRRGGGLFNSVRRLSQQLPAEGIEVEVLGLEGEFLAEDFPAWQPLRAKSFPIVGPKSFGWSPKFSAALEQSGADIAHCHGLWMHPSLACLRWAKKNRRPYIVSPRGMLDPWARRRSRWKKQIAGLLFQNEHLRRAACIHALCQPEAEAIRAAGLQNPICVIPNGVYLPSTAPSQAAPWAEKISPGGKVLLYLGRLHPKKNLANLLRAWREVQNHAQEWHLVIAGWDQGGYERELKILAQKIETRRVIFPGAFFGEKKEAALAACDAFVLPSLSEGLPMAVLEAWAHAKPVLMTRACNLPDGFAHRAAIEIGTDADALARGLGEVFSIPENERFALGIRGRERVQARYLWRQIAREMSTVYRWILEGGTAPDCITVSALA